MKHIVPPHAKPQFLNKYASEVFTLVSSKSKANKMIEKKELLVNSQPVKINRRVFPGDTITVSKKQTAQKQTAKIFKEKLEVLYEDAHIAAINKPGGMPVNGNKSKTLENALPFNLKPSKEPDALPAPMPLHRLDDPTCGIVLVAKTGRAQVQMGRMFESKTIRKQYKAVVIGKLDQKKGCIKSPIKGKPCHTEFEALSSSASADYRFLSLVKLKPVTGRTHQLRIHMSELGHPIVGDKYYSNSYKILSGKGLMLCSDEVCFPHPMSGKDITISISIPNKFKKYMEREAYMAGK